MIRQAILSLTCACVAVLTHAQEFTLTELPTQKQLPVANIHSIMQDSEGFMWYATKGGGLCRDNGYHIDVFRSDRLTPGAIGNSNNILSIAEDKQKRIIFSSTDGLFVLDKHDYQIHRLDEQLRGKRVEVVKVTDDGTIWASSQNVIHHYDAELKRIGVYPSEWQGKGVNVTHFYEDSHSTLWAAQWDGGIIRYNKARDLFEPQPWINGLTPGGIIEDKTTGCYWVSTWGKGIVKYWPEEARFEPQGCTIYHRSQASQVMYMRMDKSGRMLWTSTMEGLYGYEIREGQLARINLGGLLPEGTCIIDELTFDRQGNLWVPGFSPLTFILSPKDDGITRYGLETQKMRFGGRLIVWYAARENGWIWIEHDRLGLSIYDTQQDRMLFASQTPDVDAAKFCKSSTRTGIWCFSGNRLSRLWFEDGKFKQESIVTTDSPIKCLYDDGHGRVYLGKADGIDCYDDHTKRLNHHLTGIQKVIGDYTAFVIDRQETLWAVDRKGNLFFHNPKDRRSGIDETGSNSNGDAIKDITIDTSGHLWLLSDQHLKEYNPKSGAYRIVHNQDKAIRLDYFCSITPDGDGVCVSGAGGILAIKPTADIDSRTSFVKPQITSVSIDGQPHIMGLGEEQIDIHPDAVNVELQFSTLNYLNADKVQYAYRLKGLDNEWHHLQPGNNKASFFGLGKGHYILEVKATDEYGRWSDNITSLRLYRKPAWYETWMADLAYALICLLIIGMAVRRYIIKQKRQQQQKMQEELTEMKFRFFTNISHELRTPLTLIVTPLQSLMKRLEQWHEEDAGNERVTRVQSQVAMVNDNANRLLTLVNRLLDFRKLEMGQQKLELASGDVHNFIRSVCETFRPMSQEKGIGLGYAIPNRSLTIYFDGNKLRHILTNLLSNAFKFTDEGGNIAVTVSTLEDRQLSISVKDNGCGIAQKDLEHIFDRYYQSGVRTDVTGTGIGLNMVQEFAHLHGGTVNVESRQGEGTTFTVMLPTTLKPEGENQQVGNDKAQPHTTPTLLIVDDNDDFRQFLTSELSDDYRILQAANGEEAEQIVNAKDIDLVVSDVMMPVMDGIQLCQRIKQNVNTSHVMVILLTARTADESKLEGLRSGADDYLSKPFNMEMLRLRISHLLQLRKSRTEKFAKGEEVKVEEMATSELDRKFLNNAMAAVEKNLSNDSYDIESFSQDLCMSRSTLYRKVVSLTGQKPSEFIRTIRLKRAAKLIKENRYAINEISDMCGFSSASYFCRCFKAQYGVQPGSYQ